MNYQIFKCFDKKMTKTTEPKGGSKKNVPKGGSQKNVPKGGSKKNECKMIEPKSGSKNKNKRVGGSNPPSQENMKKLNKITEEEKAYYKQQDEAEKTQKRARNTKEWWVSVYYYLLFKYTYPEFLIEESNANAKRFRNDTKSVLNKDALRENLWKENYNELLKYLFHAGDGDLSHEDPNPVVIKSRFYINYYVNLNRYKFYEAKNSTIVPDSLIDHCYKQFNNGRNNLNDFGIFGRDNIRPLLAVFIHYTINNFKQQMNLCKEQSCEEIFRESLQIFYIAPGLLSLYSTPKFEFMNYPGVLYHYIEVIKKFHDEEEKKNKYKYKATLEIKRHYNGKNMADDLFVSDINNNLNDAYDQVNVNNTNYSLVFEKKITLQNILDMKTKYKDYYSALKDGWFGNNNSKDFYNIRKSVLDLFKFW
jgi:hypothetical protein